MLLWNMFDKSLHKLQSVHGHYVFLPIFKRETKLSQESKGFAERVKQMNPEVIVIILRKIEKIVRKALTKAGGSAKVYVIPFPDNGYQVEYQTLLVPIVREFSK